MTAPAARPSAGSRFVLPPASEARETPEERGLPRDGVRLLTATPSGVRHDRFRDLPGLLQPGDLLVVNTSRTLPAALDAVRADGRSAPLHVSSPLDDGSWAVELRRPDGAGPDRERRPGESLRLPGGVVLRLLEPWPDPDAEQPRLWRADVRPRTPLEPYLDRWGRPVRYAYVPRPHPLPDYQTIFGSTPESPSGSAEMASAGRPFTAELVLRLVARGIVVAPVLLHAGVSSPEAGEAPLPERFEVPVVTARLVDATRASGGRVVAVGTTVVRALESATDRHGVVAPARGWTSLVLGPQRPARAVTGLVTGLHAPEASHLELLEAVAGPDLVREAYAAAVAGGYLWHEFGDSTLFLPRRRRPREQVSAAST